MALTSSDRQGALTSLTPSDRMERKLLLIKKSINNSVIITNLKRQNYVRRTT